MIKKLKLKFIILSMTTLLILLTVIISGMNLISFNAIKAEADEIVMLLSHNKGRFPEPKKRGESPVPSHMSPEIPYESRYFWVLIDDSGNIIQAETSKIASVSTADAIEYADEIMADNKDKGFIDIYRYKVTNEAEGIRITFLDCRRDLASFKSFAAASAGMALVGYVIVFFVILFFAGRIVRPVAESYDKQKRFITDAGHEIKTPLTIINANADVLEMEIGENECITDIQQQTKKLADLTNELVYLARMEEETAYVKMEDINLSELIANTIHSFSAPARTRNIDIFCNIQPSLTVKGELKALEQLLSILMDNALKYAPEKSIISIDFRREGKMLSLHIVNAVENKLNSKELQHVFERFYRPDLSRSAETGGHGIGLSVAKAIVTSHKGKIQAWTPDEKSFHITVTLPALSSDT